VLVLGDQLVGIAAVRTEPDPVRVVAARVALELACRREPLPRQLVDGCVMLAREAGGELVRLWVPERADRASRAAQAAGFTPVRSSYHMLLPAETPVPAPAEIPGVRRRAIRPGEEQRVLEALNRAWDGTWDFVPIPLEMFERDLDGQRDGMLLAVDAADDSRIVGTCHAVFDRSDRNPDGHPRAWISNLTVDPAYRGRGLARSMLQAGIAHLRARGAQSVTLGVDAGDPAPLKLYQSAGFGQVSSTVAWDRPLT
jgi:mycothiol synthase